MNYILLRLFLIIFISSFLCSVVFSQPEQTSGKKYKTNLEIFDEIISNGLEHFIYYPGISREVPFVFIVNSNDSGKNKKEETRYLTSLIKRKAGEENIKFSFIDNQEKLNQDSSYNIFIINSVIMKTTYNGFKKNRFLGEKIINRDINIKISINIISNYNNFKLSDFIAGTSHDEVNLDDYESIESAGYSFSHSDPPKISEFESVMFPAILITASAAATLLFFIIRTK